MPSATIRETVTLFTFHSCVCRTSMFYVLCSLLLLAGTGVVYCEVFTALVHMEGLLDLEGELLASLNSYITAERQRLNSLETFADRVQLAQDVASSYGDLKEDSFNPINAFQLVNRYINGWMVLEDNLFTTNVQDLMANISLNNYRFPSREDFEGTVTAIRRLQETYELPSSTFASGKLGSTLAIPMSVNDCCIIARLYVEKQNWHQSSQWYREALNTFAKGGDLDVTLADLLAILEHLSFIEYQLYNNKMSALYTKVLMQLQNETSNERAITKLRNFMKKTRTQLFTDVRTEVGTTKDQTEKKEYEAICREGRAILPEDHHKLTCYYWSNNRNPRLVIRPAKLEVVFLEPKIYVFHDIISEPEMSRLKELAEPKLKRAQVRNTLDKGRVSRSRIGKSGWLGASDDPLGYVTRIDQRIEDITGLSMETAEMLQVVNYGIGGYYEPHYDFAQDSTLIREETGRRIATLLFYLSDVELGGATAFPIVGARIPPNKGDAAFWWNLKKSGEGDDLTKHAGCPVLVGSKWVCNKWIHERGQEFRRPCGLSPDE